MSGLGNLGTNIDDDSLVSDQFIQGKVSQGEDMQEIFSEGFKKVGGRGVQAHTIVGTGIVNEAVDPARSFKGAINGLTARILVGELCGDAKDLVWFRTQFINQLFGNLRISVGNGNNGPFL